MRGSLPDAADCDCDCDCNSVMACKPPEVTPCAQALAGILECICNKSYEIYE